MLDLRLERTSTVLMIEDELGNDLEDETALTRARAQRCPGEYQQMVKSFGRLLALVYNE